MSKNTFQTNLSTVPRKGLYEAILARIDSEKIRRAYKKFVALVSAAIVSFLVFIYAIIYTIDTFAQSSFPHYMSLIFSEGTGLLGYWHEFLYAVTESLPILSITLLLTTLGVLLLLMKNIIKNYGVSHPVYS